MKHLAIAFTLMLTGCAGLFGGADMATVHAQAMDVNDALIAATHELNEARPWIAYWCRGVRESDPLCVGAIEGADFAADALPTAKSLVDKYNENGTGYELVEMALAELKRDFKDVRRLVAKAKAVADDLDRATPAGVGPRSDQGAGPPAQEPAVAPVAEDRPASEAPGAEAAP